MQDRFPAQERFKDGAQYIAGRLTHGTSGRTHTVVDPATGEEVLTYALASTADVDAAVAASAKWSEVSGVSSAGFRTMVLPAAIAGRIFHAAIWRG